MSDRPDPVDENPREALKGWSNKSSWEPDETPNWKTCTVEAKFFNSLKYAGLKDGDELIQIGTTERKNLPVFASPADSGRVQVGENEEIIVGTLQTWRLPGNPGGAGFAD